MLFPVYVLVIMFLLGVVVCLLEWMGICADVLIVCLYLHCCWNKNVVIKFSAYDTFLE